MSMHADEGVDVRLSTKLEGARGNGAVEELRLSGGETARLRRGRGRHRRRPRLGMAGGQRPADGRGRSPTGRGARELPHVFAAGDVARGFDHRVGEHRRTEHWDAAAGRAMAAARAMLGEEPGLRPAAELLERSVRDAHPVRRPRRSRRRGHRRGPAGRSQLRRRLHAPVAAPSAPSPSTTHARSRGSARRSSGLTPSRTTRREEQR